MVKDMKTKGKVRRVVIKKKKHYKNESNLSIQKDGLNSGQIHTQLS
jgi:hypothetical protein